MGEVTIDVAVLLEEVSAADEEVVVAYVADGAGETSQCACGAAAVSVAVAAT